MNIEKLNEFELEITTKKGIELINLINKLGIKNEVLALFGGGSNEKKDLMMAYSKKQVEWQESLKEDIESKMSMYEYEEKDQKEQAKIIEDVISLKTKNLNIELNILEDKVQSMSLDNTLNLVYTAIIERYYPNAKVIEKTLASLFNVKVEEIQNQKINVTFAMLKKILDSEDFQACLKAFTTALH